MSKVRSFKCSCGYENEFCELNKYGQAYCFRCGNLTVIDWVAQTKTTLLEVLPQLPLVAISLLWVVLIPVLIALFGTAIRDYIKYNW